MSTPTGDKRPWEFPGAARARTRLSWRRTLLSATAVALLTVRAALRVEPLAVRAPLIALAVAGWAALSLVARYRIAALSALPPHAARRTPALVALGLAGFAVLGIVAAALAGQP